ncbi:DUF4157 domain-containing protein [Myxococcota bacterium]|nr:DUF4157 domain-containing protein [Myxococcota bacterium]
MARKSPGSATVSRLTGRLDRSELQRQAMPDGGQVYRGPLASRALKAVGARAMTLDRSVIVADDFNMSRPEDQALYAHERVHATVGDGQGGGGGDGFRDAEEIAARATEAMVFHRMAGGFEGGNEPGAGPGTYDPHKAQHQGGGVGGHPQGTDTMTEAPDNPDASRGYWALRDKDLTHQDVVEQLARQVLDTVDNKKQAHAERHADKRGSF